jgi:hypothetical protein
VLPFPGTRPTRVRVQPGWNTNRCYRGARASQLSGVRLELVGVDIVGDHAGPGRSPVSQLTVVGPHVTGGDAQMQERGGVSRIRALRSPSRSVAAVASNHRPESVANRSPADASGVLRGRRVQPFQNAVVATAGPERCPRLTARTPARLLFESGTDSRMRATSFATVHRRSSRRSRNMVILAMHGAPT